MAKENGKQKEEEFIREVNENPENLLKKYDEEKNRREKQRQKENPDGRVTGEQLKTAVSAVAGIRNKINGQVVEEGLANKRFEKHRKFATKLVKNFREARNELEVIKGVCPEYPADLKKEIEDYEQRRLQIAKDNAGIPKDKDVDSVTMGQIKAAGNEKLFAGEIDALDESFSEMLARKERFDNTTEKIMNRPLSKPNFDMISECEIPPELSAAEIDAIWIFIKQGDC